MNDAFPQIKVGQLKSLPIKIESEKNQTELNKLVDQLLKLNEEKSTTKLATQVSQFESKIDYCEEKINQAVYQLYELTEAEIKIINKQ